MLHNPAPRSKATPQHIGQSSKENRPMHAAQPYTPFQAAASVSPVEPSPLRIALPAIGLSVTNRAVRFSKLGKLAKQPG
jgi:hypothetical protein